MNKVLLKYYIAKTGMKPDEFYSKLGISKSSFYNKINFRTPFTLADVIKITQVCELNKEDVWDIFFDKSVYPLSHVPKSN